MVSGLAVSVLLSWLARAYAGSGCNEAVDDPGPWVSQLDIQKTEEGFELALHLVGGDVASSSTESVELLVSETSKSKKQHFVLQKTGTRKGGIMEVRTQESLPADTSELSVTLAEYNGNSHGPELMRCTAQGQNFGCLRVQKAALGPKPTQPAQMPQGSGQMAGHMNGMHGMHGAGSMQSMHEQMHQPGHSGSPALRQATPMRASMPLALGDVCTPGHSTCPGGAQCKAAVAGFTCQGPVVSGLSTPSTLTLTQSLRMALIGALVLLICLCTVGCLYRRQLRDSRNFVETPKVMGKTNLDLPKFKPQKFIEASDSEEEYRTF